MLDKLPLGRRETFPVFDLDNWSASPAWRFPLPAHVLLPLPTLLHQTFNRLTQINPVRPAGRVAELGVRVDAELVEDRRRQIRGRVSARHRHAALGVRLADDLTALDPAAGEEAGEHVAPVMTARREDF